MLSNKMTFSLTSLIICLMFAFVATVMGDGDFKFSASFTPGELMVDVSSIDHAGVTDIQVGSGRDRATAYPEAADATLQLDFAIEFGKVVQLYDFATDTVASVGTVGASAGALGLDDFVVEAYDDLQRSLGAINLVNRVDADGDLIAPGATGYADATPLAALQFRTPQAVNVADPGELPGRQFRLEVFYEALANAYDDTTGGELEIHTLLFQLKHNAVVDASLGIRQDFLTDDKADIAHNSGPVLLRVDLVNDDEGDAEYSTIDSATAATEIGAGVPGVVAVTRVLTRSDIAAIATGAFDVRIVLTEEPAAFTSDNIRVLNGTAADPVQLLPIPAASLSEADFPGLYDADDDFPEPTGRDNMYHLYIVTITPTAGTDGNVTVSVDNFEDQVLPDSNEFVGLTQAQLLADTLTSDALTARDTRVPREAISVRTVADPTTDATIFKASTDAKLPHEHFIAGGLVIPARGYLVLASGTYAQAGILAASADKDKVDVNLRTGEADYNTVEKFDPPYPGSDLANFFRNGATISLVYQDFPGNNAVANKDTDYPGATSAVIAKGAVLINEIMWGYDRGLDNRAYTEGQWIELHNTTAAPISLDTQEWTLVYGTTSSVTGGTVIDTVSNNPAIGYWAAPGKSGVSSSDPAVKTGVAVEVEGTKEDIQILDREIDEVVSMSRVAGGTDGTAATSWAMSILPTANFSTGGRIGTPGAANSYPEVPVVDTPAVDVPPAVITAPVAKATDIVISEIMVASNDGRLPQWIEIANVSAAAVSLTGWSLVVDNDSADADVVGASIEVSLGDTEIGKGQVALVVSKESRINSGVSARAPGDANAGDLDSNRIINVQDQVSPTNNRYSLISEMGFMIALMPPQTGAVKTYGDMVGNLGKGWMLPMSEGDRSSLIRREMGNMAAGAAAATGAEIMGTDVAGWVLASDTMLNGAYVNTFYGHGDDAGTPGYNAGGALPVELSKFGAKRDPLTGQVQITWETQSELNNAGFFIKRSQQRNSQFVVVNPTMVPGAGTTSEKQSYTYADTTASPNIVYYYQIEDVSLDGNRQTLTRAHRLKGHIGAAGKLTTLWGELKERE